MDVKVHYTSVLLLSYLKEKRKKNREKKLHFVYMNILRLVFFNAIRIYITMFDTQCLYYTFGSLCLFRYNSFRFHSF